MPLLAHISDIHLLSLQGASPLDFVGKRLTGGANLLLNRGGKYPVQVARTLVEDINQRGVDHLVVTGDVTNLSLPGEFALAGSILDRVELPPARITLVPGNHDCYTRGAQAREDFSARLARFLRGDKQPGPGHFPYLKLQDGLAVVALSSARASAPLAAVGTLGRRQIRLAEWLLAHPRCQGRFRVVALHHPPGDFGVHWHNRLTDHRRLGAMLRRVGADLVVFGHIHRHQRHELAGPGRPIPAISAGSGTWLSPQDPSRRAQYNLYTVEGGQLRGVATRRYAPQEGRFEDAEPQERP